MDHHRFAVLVHHPPHRKDRRQALAQLLGSFAAGLSLRPSAATANKRRKKRRRKRRGSSSATPGPSACTRTCGNVCNFCVARAAASLVCGEGTVTACDRACESDFDCLGTGFPYCITTIEEMATGRVSPACESPGGHCANIRACEV